MKFPTIDETFRYNEIYDQQRRSFLERTWKKDALVSEQTARIIKDLFKKKKATSATPQPTKAGISLASTLIEKDKDDRMQHKLLLSQLLAFEDRGLIRSLRIQRASLACNKLLHVLLLLKETTAAKTRELRSGPAANSTIFKVRVGGPTPNQPSAGSRATKKRKTEDQSSNN